MGLDDLLLLSISRRSVLSSEDGLGKHTKLESQWALMSTIQKVMVSIPDDLLERIDHEPDERGISRGAFLGEAARRELDRPDPAAIDAALARGRAALGRLGGFEAAGLLRAEREERDGEDRPWERNR